MARYIDGDRAVELIAILIEADKLGELTAVSDARLNECKNHKYGLLSAYRSIEQVPTADVEEVVHGAWMDDPNGSTWVNGEMLPIKVCSVCGNANPFNALGDPYYPARCDRCGAKMEERDDT